MSDTDTTLAPEILAPGHYLVPFQGRLVELRGFYVPEDRTVGVWGGGCLEAINGRDLPDTPYVHRETTTAAVLAEAGLPGVALEALTRAWEAVYETDPRGDEALLY